MSSPKLELVRLRPSTGNSTHIQEVRGDLGYGCDDNCLPNSSPWMRSQSYWDGSGSRRPRIVNVYLINLRLPNKVEIVDLHVNEADEIS